MSRWFGIAAAAALVIGGTAEASIYQTLYTFPFGGGNLMPPLVLDSSGAFYGVASESSASIVKLTPSGSKWTESLIYLLPNEALTGCAAISGLVRDKAGNFFGLTSGCWPQDDNGNGVAYEVSPPKTAGGTWTGRVVFEFASPSNPAGDDPAFGLTIDRWGNLFGATMSGYFYVLTPPHSGSGTWNSTRLGNVGGDPNILDVGGRLYAETRLSSNSPGNIIEIERSGTGWEELDLSEFAASDAHPPLGGLVMDRAGNLYGVAGSGGRYHCGSVFELAPTTGSSHWTLTTLHDFTCADGKFPDSRLLRSGSGILYGVTTYGGNGGAAQGDTGEGVIFSLTPPAKVGGSWTYRILYQPPTGFVRRPSWAFDGPLVFGPDRALYGVANGPAGSGGSVFRLVP